MLQTGHTLQKHHTGMTWVHAGEEGQEGCMHDNCRVHAGVPVAAFNQRAEKNNGRAGIPSKYRMSAKLMPVCLLASWRAFTISASWP